jgi:hypothetical protein
MAIDSAQKRASAAGVGFFVVGPGMTPDSTPDQFWRQTSAWSYGGILAGGSGPVTGQIPRPSKYRTGHRVDYYHALQMQWAWL